MPDSFPTFESIQILTAAQLNTLVSAITSRLSALTGANLSYPLVLAGNIDFNRQHQIVGLRTFWNIFNVDEYTTIQAAIDAAEAAGGGCVFFPTGLGGSHAHVADGLTVDSDNIWLVGAGPASEVKLTTASTSGYLVRTGIGITGFGVCNMTINGQSTGAAQKGIIMRQVTEGQVINCRVKNFTGACLQFTAGNAAGDECADCTVSNTKFTGGSTSHIIGDDIDGLSLLSVVSRSAGANAIALEPTAANSLMRNIKLVNVDVSSTTGKGIYIVGQSGVASDNHGRVSLDKCTVITQTGVAIEIGTTSKIMKYVTVDTCTAHDSAADGIVIVASGGNITGNYAYSAASDGIDITGSIDLYVTGNHCQDAGAYAINASTTTDCTVTNNNCRDAATAGINKASATGLRATNNAGVLGPSTATAYTDYTSSGLTGTGNFTATKVIPANTVRPGDVIRVTAFFTGGTATTTIRLATVAGQNLGGGNTDAQDNWFQWMIKVNTAASLSSILIVQNREAGTVASGNATAAVDWTVDNTLRFECTAYGGGTVTHTGLFIEMMGTE